MAVLNKTGIVTTAKNVCIPIANAGVGDAIAIKNNTDGESLSDFIAVVGSSVESTAPSGYSWYGTVYGRENNGLMIRSFAPTEVKWATSTLNSSSHANVIGNTISVAGLMRNGLTAYNGIYAAMSVGEVAYANNDNTATNLHPDSPLSGSGHSAMGEDNFNDDTNGAKTMYGTYANYIAQLLPIMKGDNSGVFGKRCGKINTNELASSSDFPAAQYCYYHSVDWENIGHWWLPDMYELAVMMSDDSFNRCKYAHSIIGGDTARGTYRWSSVRRDNSSAWCYHQKGYSTGYGFDSIMVACPVTLLSLI